MKASAPKKAPKRTAPTNPAALSDDAYSVEVPIRFSHAAKSITCDRMMLEIELHNAAMSAFAPAIADMFSSLDDDNDRAALEALANWAADRVAEQAMLYYLNIDLPSLAWMCAKAASIVSLRRAIERLPKLEPDGEFGLRNDEERTAWRQFASLVPKKSDTREIVERILLDDVHHYLMTIDMKGEPGRAKGKRDSFDSKRYRERVELHGRLRMLIRAKAEAELTSRNLPVSNDAIERQVRAFKIKTLARELAPDIGKSPAATEKIITRLKARKKRAAARDKK